MKPEVLALSLLRTAECRTVHYQSEWMKLKTVAEIAVDPIAHFLYNERSPRDALRKLQTVLRSWGFVKKFSYAIATMLTCFYILMEAHSGTTMV